MGLTQWGEILQINATVILENGEEQQKMGIEPSHRLAGKSPRSQGTLGGWKQITINQTGEKGRPSDISTFEKGGR